MFTHWDGIFGGRFERKQGMLGNFIQKGGNCFLIGLYIYFAKFIFLQCTQREHDYN